jgi:hypothetical protein
MDTTSRSGIRSARSSSVATRWNGFTNPTRPGGVGDRRPCRPGPFLVFPHLSLTNPRREVLFPSIQERIVATGRGFRAERPEVERERLERSS